MWSVVQSQVVVGCLRCRCWSMGERTPPCGTPDLNCRFVDVWFLNVVYAMRPLM